MKFNMGCGNNPIPGWMNVDKYPVAWAEKEFAPEFWQWDLEHVPWPRYMNVNEFRPGAPMHDRFKDNIADEVIFNHSLEHMGRDPDIFLGIMKELYRISKNEARIQINVPHPRHDDFINDPTHVRAITPELLALFDKQNCKEWRDNGSSNTPFAEILDVDFYITKIDPIPDIRFRQWLKEKGGERYQKSAKGVREIAWLLNTANNCISEIWIELRVRK